MKNVIYINCWVEPWIQVAKELRDKHGYAPAWWIGYSKEDDSHRLVPQEFPGIIYQDNADAWKGRFPKEVEAKAAETYLDADFLRKHSQYELQAIKMMDRVDMDRRSFNFMERQRHFRNMLKQWMAAIEIVKPDLVVSTAIPHRLYDYVLFWLCKERNIPFLMMEHTQFVGRFFFLRDNFYTIGDKFTHQWHFFEQSSDNKWKSEIPEDISSRFEKVKLDYASAAPAYMAAEEKRKKQLDNKFFLLKTGLQKLATEYLPYLLGQPADTTIIGRSAYGKRANKKYEESEGNIYQNIFSLTHSFKYVKKLKKAYDALTSTPDYSEPYVIVFLHYQPEATTCPGGDIFVDQRLCVESLLKQLPNDWKVYVKEHPHQFLKKRIGHTSRMRDLYDDLAKCPRVKLIPTEVNTFDLIKHSQAISTITGTVGWEAIVRQKPVIAFGLCWYENYTKGVLRITDGESEKKIYDFIQNYKYDEQSLAAYLASVGKETRRAYYFKNAHKDNLGITEKECVDNLVAAITEQL